MCAACGVPTHVAVLEPGPAGGAGQPGEQPGRRGEQPAKFAALRNRSCRVYLGGATLVGPWVSAPPGDAPVTVNVRPVPVHEAADLPLTRLYNLG